MQSREVSQRSQRDDGNRAGMLVQGIGEEIHRPQTVRGRDRCGQWMSQSFPSVDVNGVGISATDWPGRSPGHWDIAALYTFQDSQRVSGCRPNRNIARGCGKAENVHLLAR